jgi:hypothetical protein
MGLQHRIKESQKRDREEWIKLSEDMTLYEKVWKYNRTPVENCSLKHRMEEKELNINYEKISRLF